MGMLDRIRATLTGSGGNGSGSEGQPPTRPHSAQPVDDWPSAVAVPTGPIDSDAGFDADTAPAGTLGVLSWTPGLLVGDGSGEGFWDYWDLHAWAAGTPEPLGLEGDMGHDASRIDLQRWVAAGLGRPVVLTPSSMTSTLDGSTWWTTPLFVVGPRA